MTQLDIQKEDAHADTHFLDAKSNAELMLQPCTVEEPILTLKAKWLLYVPPRLIPKNFTLPLLIALTCL
jgi:hypothetical protein